MELTYLIRLPDSADITSKFWLHISNQFSIIAKSSQWLQAEPHNLYLRLPWKKCKIANVRLEMRNHPEKLRNRIHKKAEVHNLVDYFFKLQETHF